MTFFLWNWPFIYRCLVLYCKSFRQRTEKPPFSKIFLFVFWNGFRTSSNDIFSHLWGITWRKIWHIFSSSQLLLQSIFQVKPWRLLAKEQRVMESLNSNLKRILTGIKASAEKRGEQITLRQHKRISEGGVKISEYSTWVWRPRFDPPLAFHYTLLFC